MEYLKTKGCTRGAALSLSFHLGVAADHGFPCRRVGLLLHSLHCTLSLDAALRAQVGVMSSSSLVAGTTPLGSIGSPQPGIARPVNVQILHYPYCTGALSNRCPP